MSSSPLSAEMTQFEAMESPEDLKGAENVLKWFKKHSSELPRLCRIVQSVFCVPASSSSSERVSSQTGQLCTKKRMSLAASKVEELLVIHQNADLIENLTKEFNIPKKTDKEKACIDPQSIISVEAAVKNTNNNEDFDDEQDFTMFNDSDEEETEDETEDEDRSEGED